MKTFIHIGFPKNFSTSLQTQYFSKHPQLLHLGSGIEKNYGCLTDEIELLLEVYLKTANTYVFEKDKAHLKNSLSETIQNNINSNHRAVTISSEHLSFSYTNDCLDLETKMERLSFFFDGEVEFIAIIRNQWDLLKSNWKEYVRTGYPENFNYFLNSVYKYQHNNFYHDFNYLRTLHVLKNYFPEAKVWFLPFEEFRQNEELSKRNDTPVLIQTLDSILGLENFSITFENRNKAIPDCSLEYLIRLNKTARRDVSNLLLESAEVHRLEKWFNNALLLNLTEEEIFHEVKIKRENIARSLKHKSATTQLFECDIRMKERILSYYTECNRKFSVETEIELPKAYDLLSNAF